MPHSVGIIGAGIAGLATAIRLALKGYKITIFESNSLSGGKMGQLSLKGYRFDTGPSLFTMPEFVKELYVLAGKNPDLFPYQQLEISANYFYNDGTTVKAYADHKKLETELEQKLNEPPANVRGALQNSAHLYKLLADLFIHRPLDQWNTFFNKKAFRAYFQLHRLELFKTMHASNVSRFREEKTVQLFDRYATYNGSDPYQTPATMNIIPHLEFGIGAFLPEKGMFQIAESLYLLAVELGVDFRFNQRVDKIQLKDKKAVGLTCDGVDHPFDYVISNMDMVATYKKLLPDTPPPRMLLNQPKSSSALIFYWGIKKEFPQLDLHNIFFSGDYQKEFEHIFSRKSIYEDPTVYVNITSKYVAGDAPAHCENWFTMINVPNNEGQDWNELRDLARKNIIKKLSRLLSCDLESLIEAESYLDPPGIETRTSSWQGALYGNSSNNKYAAFLRHTNKSRKIKNLFFCGGSVHPGGGIPLCLSSAKIVSEYFPARGRQKTKA